MKTLGRDPRRVRYGVKKLNQRIFVYRVAGRLWGHEYSCVWVRGKKIPAGASGVKVGGALD